MDNEYSFFQKNIISKFRLSLSSHDSMSSGGFGGGGVNYDSPRNVLQQPYYNQQQQQQQYTVRNGSDGATSPRYIRFYFL